MQIHIYETAEQACRAAAFLFAAQLTRKPESVLGLATGSTPVPCYRDLIAYHQQGLVDFSRVTTFNLDEYCGIDYQNPCSYHAFMEENLFRHVNLRAEAIHLPDAPRGDDGGASGRAYDAAIEAAGGIDLQLLGIGRNGHIGFNEPADAFTYGTHVVNLSQNTIDANARFFDSVDDVPRQAISTGIGNIMACRSVVLIASGESKGAAVLRTVHGPIDPHVPASILSVHPSVTILLDREAASLLPAR